MSARSTVYRIDNLVTGHFYIGCTTKSLERRLYNHFMHAKLGNCPLHRLMQTREYRRDEFVIEELEVVDFLIAKERESTYIREHIDDPLCLSKRVEGRTRCEKIELKRQYYLDNKDSYHLRYIQNRDKILTKKKFDYHLKKYCRIFGQSYGFEFQIKLT